MERKEDKIMKKLLSVLMASAMLCTPVAASASDTDNNCKIKDFLSNISQYTACTDGECSVKAPCDIFDLIGGVFEKNDAFTKDDIAQKLFDIIKEKLPEKGENVNPPEKLPEEPATPPADFEEELQTPASDNLKQIVDLVNSYRAQYGIAPVSYDAAASCAAQKRAAETEKLFSHTRPDGSRCFTALDECGVSYRGAGENIAVGQTSAKQVMTEWMNSQGHRENILNESFTKLGVGFHIGADGRYYWTQMFIY